MISPVATLEGHKDKVWFLSWHPQGKILASCSSDRSIRLWGKEGESWACKGVSSDAHSRTIRSLAWSPSGNHLASASFDSTVNIWENVKGELECIATLEGHENEVKSVTWSTSGSYIATCSRDKSVWVWEVSDDNEYECMSVLPTHTHDVKKVLFHPNEDLLVSASYDNTIKVFKHDGDEWEEIQTLEGHTSTVWSLDFNVRGDCLISCSDDLSVRVWQRKTNDDNQNSKWTCISTLTGYHHRPIYDIRWCPLSGAIATACGDDSIRIFKQSDGGTSEDTTFECVLTIPDAHAEDVNTVLWHPSELGLLASGSDDGTIKIWDLSTIV